MVIFNQILTGLGSKFLLLSYSDRVYDRIDSLAAVTWSSQDLPTIASFRAPERRYRGGERGWVGSDRIWSDFDQVMTGFRSVFFFLDLNQSFFWSGYDWIWIESTRLARHCNVALARPTLAIEYVVGGAWPALFVCTGGRGARGTG